MKNSSMQTIDYEDFEKIDFRIGTILEVEDFLKARKPSYKIWIGKQVLCVCNFQPRQIADFMSEVLVTGFLAAEGGVILTTVERAVPNGSKLH